MNSSPTETGSHEAGLLIDGSLPFTSNDVFRLLDADSIPHSTLQHKPLRTVEEAKSVRPADDFGHTKNLFLRNKKGQMWLLTLHENRQVDLRAMAEAIGAKRFSFASPDRLMQYLGVIPGAVSPFALLNDRMAAVQFLIDKELVKHAKLHIHPLDNTMTTSVDCQMLLAFLQRHGHPYGLI